TLRHHAAYRNGVHDNADADQSPGRERDRRRWRGRGAPSDRQRSNRCTVASRSARTRHAVDSRACSRRNPCQRRARARMIPVSFDYARPGSLLEAARLVASTADGGVILAGGQSLLTDLKQRTKRPRLVIDIGAIPGLDAIELGAESLRIGAMGR